MLSNKCGRDFVYFALNFYYPEAFNKSRICPVEMDRLKLLGQPVPKWLAWTQIQFYTMPEYLKTKGLRLSINNKLIKSFYDFVTGNIFSGFKISYEDAIGSIQSCVDLNIACAIDIPVRKGLLALQDHVMFVYGYDEENLYVFDTLTVKGLGYVKVEGEQGLYTLPKSLIRKNWSHLGRFWKVEKVL
jgi:hypothetical protein